MAFYGSKLKKHSKASHWKKKREEEEEQEVDSLLGIAVQALVIGPMANSYGLRTKAVIIVGGLGAWGPSPWLVVPTFKIVSTSCLPFMGCGLGVYE